MHQFVDCPFHSRYQYKGFWIETFFESNFELQLGDELSGWYASVELGGKRGGITSKLYPDRQTAEFAAEELINSWN